MFRLLTALTCLFPVTAEATCPTQADLAEGIVLVQNFPHFRRADFETTPLGMTEERVDRAGGGTGRATLLYRHGLAQIEEIRSGGTWRYSYHGNLSQLDRLDTLGAASLDGTATDNTGTRRDFILQVRFVEPHRYHLAECPYDAWRVSYEIATAGRGTETLHMDYAPELGVVLSARRMTDDGKVIPLFGYTWIGTKADVKR